MNRCDYQSLLSQYLDRQLDAQATSSLEQHLPLCPQCRHELEQLTALTQMCSELPEADLPAGLHERIMAEVRRAGEKRNLSWVRRAAIPLAAAVMIFLLGRGLPGLSNYKSSTMQGNSGEKGMLMTVQEERSEEAPENISEEDTMLAGSMETPMITGTDDSEQGVAKDSSSIRTAGESEADTEKTVGNSFAPNEGTDKGILAAQAGGKNQSRFERPSYLKYGIIIALVVGLGLALIRLMTKRKVK